jgi:pilus assembly protein Flp/PilA
MDPEALLFQPSSFFLHPSEAASEPGKGERCMNTWIAKVARFLRDEDGPTAVEYAVMLALIIVVCIAAITSLGSNANNTFSNVALNAAVSSSS